MAKMFVGAEVKVFMNEEAGLVVVTEFKGSRLVKSIGRVAKINPVEMDCVEIDGKYYMRGEQNLMLTELVEVQDSGKTC